MNDATIAASEWRNAYWFLRILINTDKYGALGKSTRGLIALAANVYKILDQQGDLGEQAVIALVHNEIDAAASQASSRSRTKRERYSLLADELKKRIQTFRGCEVFAFALERMLIPTSLALPNIPSNDREFAERICQAHLIELGERGLATVINLWDDIGSTGSIEAERISIVSEFGRLRHAITEASRKRSISEFEVDIVLTAFVQEFERRLGQKRKARAGESLQGVTSLILNHFKIKSAPAPEHFRADIEVDNWIKCKNGWLIGISCKRTLRERWKQLSSADSGVLSSYKIKAVWHVVTYDEDLSDDKLTQLGQQRHVFYLRDQSRRLKEASDHIGMQDYVRPMSQFIRDAKKEAGIST